MRLLILLILFCFSCSIFAQNPYEAQYQKASKELNALTSKSNLSQSEVQRAFVLQNMVSELDFQRRFFKEDKGKNAEKLPLTVEAPMATVRHPNYKLHKLLNNLQDVLESPKSVKRGEPEKEKSKPKVSVQAVREIAREYVNTCSKMGCFCGKEGVPPSCYEEPYKCCDTKPKDKKESNPFDKIVDHINKQQAKVPNEQEEGTKGQCVEIGCFCGQANIPPVFYDETYRCCPGEAPTHKTELETLSEYLSKCNKYDGAISCPDGTYIKGSDDSNTIFKLMDHVNGQQAPKERVYEEPSYQRQGSGGSAVIER